MNTQAKCDKCGHYDRKNSMEKHGDVYHCGDCRTHDRETNDEWFDRKFEGCSCIECDRALTSKNAEMCGECDVLYCKECWTGNCSRCSVKMTETCEKCKGKFAEDEMEEACEDTLLCLPCFYACDNCDKRREGVDYDGFCEDCDKVLTFCSCGEHSCVKSYLKDEMWRCGDSYYCCFPVIKDKRRKRIHPPKKQSGK